MSTQVFTYSLRWDQNMGGNRGVTMRIETTDWETGQHVWRKCCKNKLETEVRDVVVTCNGKPFEPAGTWPRPSAISPEITAEYIDAMTPLTGAPVVEGARYGR